MENKKLIRITSVRMPVEMHWEMKKLCAHERISMHDALMEGIELVFKKYKIKRNDERI